MPDAANATQLPYQTAIHSPVKGIKVWIKAGHVYQAVVHESVSLRIDRHVQAHRSYSFLAVSSSQSPSSIGSGG